MRNISFAMTTQQIIEGTKTVTRRIGWLHLKPGEMLRPVRKCMGLKPGEKVEVLRAPIRVISVCREALLEMCRDQEYGASECVREGFPEMHPLDFIEMFCDSHKDCTPQTVVTRIEFEYTGIYPSNSCACHITNLDGHCVECGKEFA